MYALIFLRCKPLLPIFAVLSSTAVRGVGIEAGASVGSVHGAADGALGLVQLQWTPVVISGVDIQISAGV